MTSASMRRIGPFEVPPLGLGCMNLSHAYGTPPEAADAERLLLAAYDLGVRHFDTAALYGFGTNEDLVGRVLARHRDEILLASKCGMAGVNGKRVIDGRPATIRRTAEDSLRRLRTDTIDLYYLHRVDREVPVEESVGAMSELVDAGMVRAIGLSEVSASTLRRAHAIHPIAALQNEYSLWSRNPERGTLEASRELGVALVAFSPLARGVLTAHPPEVATLPSNDLRLSMPRFRPEHYGANLELRDRVASIADSAGCTVAQLSLAWVLSRQENVVVIPGTRSVAHLHENWSTLRVEVSADALAAADAVMNDRTVHGPRYASATLSEIDTERCGAAG